MSYLNDYSYNYSSGDDSFSYISDSSTSYYCPIHYQQPPPPPSSSTMCPIHQSYPFYFQMPTLQQPQYQQPIYVSNPILSSSSSSIFQVRPTKKENRRFTEEQIHILEEHFYKVDKYVNKVTIDELSNRTQLKPSQIRVWFNNKRTRQQR